MHTTRPAPAASNPANHPFGRGRGHARTADTSKVAGHEPPHYQQRTTLMGKPTGFLEYRWELPLVRPPAERRHDWLEFHGHADEAVLRQQGARCMDCGVPFCHTGTLI